MTGLKKYPALKCWTEKKFFSFSFEELGEKHCVDFIVVQKFKVYLTSYSCGLPEHPVKGPFNVKADRSIQSFLLTVYTLGKASLFQSFLPEVELFPYHQDIRKLTIIRP